MNWEMLGLPFAGTEEKTIVCCRLHFLGFQQNPDRFLIGEVDVDSPRFSRDFPPFH